MKVNREAIKGLLTKYEEFRNSDITNLNDGYEDLIERFLSELHYESKSTEFYYYLKDADKIKIGDEYNYLDGNHDDVWLVTEQAGNIFNSSKHYPHRRKIN